MKGGQHCSSAAGQNGCLFTHPPPIPAITRPAISIGAFCAIPQMNVPAAKKVQANITPALRPKISVSLPDRGCTAALAMRYPEAIHASSVEEWKYVLIGEASVATMVESAWLYQYLVRLITMCIDRYSKHTQSSKESSHPHAAHNQNYFLRTGLIRYRHIVLASIRCFLNGPMAGLSIEQRTSLVVQCRWRKYRQSILRSRHSCGSDTLELA